MPDFGNFWTHTVITRELSPLFALLLDAMDSALGRTCEITNQKSTFDGLTLSSLNDILRSRGEWDLRHELRAAVDAFEGYKPYKNWQNKKALYSTVMEFGGAKIELIHCLGSNSNAERWIAYLNVPIFYAYGMDGKGRMEHTIEAEGVNALCAAKNAAREYARRIAQRIGN